MVQPINYMALTPQVNIGQGFAQLGQAIGQNVERIEKQELADQAMQMREQYAADVQNAFNAGTPSAFAQLSAKYPQQREAFKQSWDMLSKDQQNNEFVAGAQAYNAIQAGNVDVAKSLLDQQIQAAQNSGRPVQKLTALRDSLDINPKDVANTLGFTLSAIDPDRWSKMAKEGREAQAFPVEIENIRSQISERANRFALDTDKFVSEQQAKVQALTEKGAAGPTLSANSETMLNKAVSEAVLSESIANRMRDMAAKFESTEVSKGLKGKASEQLATVLGSQDQVTELRKEYIRLRNSNVMQDLPPGTASDSDVQLALSGYLPENANPLTIASFLRGVAKLKDVESAQNNAKGEWISEVGNLGKTRKDVEIGGIKVAKGSTFSDFSRKYVDQLALRQKREREAVAAQNRSYMKYATGQ